MFDWLFEGRLAVYVVLAVAAALLLAKWWRTRRRPWLYAGGLAVALIGVYFALDRLVETDREQIQRKLAEMSAAVKARNAAGVCAHISARFRFEGADRDTLCRVAEQMMRSGEVTEIAVWDVRFPPDFRSQTGGGEQAVVQFSVKPKGSVVPGSAQFSCVATFVRDPDRQWRLRTFEVFPLGSTEPLKIPHLSR